MQSFVIAVGATAAAVYGVSKLLSTENTWELGAESEVRNESTYFSRIVPKFLSFYFKIFYPKVKSLVSNNRTNSKDVTIHLGDSAFIRFQSKILSSVGFTQNLVCHIKSSLD